MIIIAKRKRPELNYRFHDPNPPGVLADYLVKLLVEVNMPKADAAVQAWLNELPPRGEKGRVIATVNGLEHKAWVVHPRRKSTPVFEESKDALKR